MKHILRYIKPLFFLGLGVFLLFISFKGINWTEFQMILKVDLLIIANLQEEKLLIEMTIVKKKNTLTIIKIIDAITIVAKG